MLYAEGESGTIYRVGQKISHKFFPYVTQALTDFQFLPAVSVETL